MLVKNPKPAARKWLKRGALVLFLVEAVGFAVSYGLWYQVNTDRDTRKYLNDKYPLLLDYYYKTGELFDSKSKTREIDSAYWSAKQQLSGVEKGPKEVISQNQKFMNVLQSASDSNKPLYRLNKEEIEKTFKK